jgi:hypothetical protein
MVLAGWLGERECKNGLGFILPVDWVILSGIRRVPAGNICEEWRAGVSARI